MTRHRVVVAGVLALGGCWSGGIDESPIVMSDVQVSAFNCGATPGGGLRCWGVVPEELGGQADAPTASPIEVPRGGTPHLVMARSMLFSGYGCGLEAGGSAWCWGSNDMGQLGNGTRGGSSGLTRPLQPEPYQDIATGYAASCAVGRSGALYCWGAALLVGAGPIHTVDRCAPGSGSDSIPCFPAPVQVAGTERFGSVQLGDDHGCALSTSGEAWCWGSNGVGQLGLGDAIEVAEVPSRVGGLPILSSLSASSAGTCASGTDGSVWCWGANHGERFGWASTSFNGTSSPREVPRPAGVTFRSASLAGQHACALDAEGRAWCWGTGLAAGQASTGTRAEPAPVLGALRFRRIAAGGDDPYTGVGTTCGVAENGTWCWGSNAGDGTGQPQAIPVRVAGQGSPD